MSRRVPFVNNEYYHVYNRGVEKRIIFKDKQDYERFLFMLEECNQEDRVVGGYYAFKDNEVKSSTSATNKKLVVIENWCLMPNHYHLVVRQLIPGGIAKFLQKVMTGYTMYFNLRHARSGALFQGKTKSKHVDKEKYLNYLHYYIDLNPLELLYPEWKTKGVPSVDKARAYLESYPWHQRRKYTGETFNSEKFAKYALSIYKPARSNRKAETF